MRVVLLIMGIIFLFQPGTDRVEQNRLDLHMLGHTFTEAGLQLDEWEVVFRETHDQAAWEKIERQLIKDHDQNRTDESSVLTVTFTPKTESMLVDYSIQAVIPKQNAGDIRIQTILSGRILNETVEHYYDILTKHLQVDNGLVLNESFTCIKLNDNGIMDVGFSVQYALDHLNVIHKFEQTDNVEKSVYDKNIYGYSNVLTRKIDVDETEMNIQLTIRNHKADKKQVIIGTPIILDEY